MAIEQAAALVSKSGDLPVPLSIRNAVTPLMKDLQYGRNYKYDHHEAMNFSGQEFLPDALMNTTLYEPGQNAREEEIRKFLKIRWKEKYGY